MGLFFFFGFPRFVLFTQAEGINGEGEVTLYGNDGEGVRMGVDLVFRHLLFAGTGSDKGCSAQGDLGGPSSDGGSSWASREAENHSSEVK